MLIEPWFIVAILLSLAGYAAYLVGLRRNLVEPNRASWLIWSATTGVEAMTYAAVNPGMAQSIVFLISGIACVVITVALWRRGAWAPPSRGESFCMIACMASLVLWIAFRQTFWAHMLVVAAVPVSFWPTWESVWEDRRREQSPAWGLWAVSDLATLLLALRTPGNGVGEFAYIFVELACHASVWFLIGLSSINPVRSIGLQDGRFTIRDALTPAANLFAVGTSHLGKAVFAAQPIAAGEVICEFTGRRFRAARVPEGIAGGRDRYVQVTEGEYLGPSGRVDDLINHSCAPNAGVRFGQRVELVAIRDIAAGEEIAWDYSTTLTESNWHMICRCGADDCRRVIGDFASLPPARQEWFRARGLVAPYLRGDAVAGGRERAA